MSKNHESDSTETTTSQKSPATVAQSVATHKKALAKHRAAFDSETNQGFRGAETDTLTPNENYTLAGVTSGLPTPENNPEHAKAVKRELTRRPAKLPVRIPAPESAELGFHGVKADETPNENYSVAGVTSGLPTPETHFDN